MSKYLYGRAVCCGVLLGDYAFDSRYLKLSDSVPTKADLIIFVANTIRLDLGLDESVAIHIKLDYWKSELEKGISDIYNYIVELEDEIFEETIMVCKVDY